MNELVWTVIAANKERQAQARQLNLRAGQKLFAVLSHEEMFAWISERIAGARSVREISSWANLRLQVFDQSLVDIVVRENPESIMLLGRRVAVEYREGFQPKVILKLDSLDDRTWRQLPNDGLWLPSGRMIELTISFGWYDSVTGTNIPQLKEQMRERLNQKLWEAWQKPVVVLPNFANAHVVIPNIITAQYGTCVVEGTPLIAYGVATLKEDRWNSLDPWFEGKWYRNKVEAEAVHAKALQKLAGIRVEARQQAEIAQAKTEAEVARQKLQGLSSRYGWYDLNYELRSEVEHRRYSYLPNSIESLRRDKVETEALIAKVEIAFTERERQEKENERLIHEIILRDVANFPARMRIIERQQNGFDDKDGDLYEDGPLPNPLNSRQKFTDVDNRWFKCPLGHTMRVDKADWRRYEQGEVLDLTCSLCSSKGIASR